MTRAFELVSSENVTLRNQVVEQAELLDTRKTRNEAKWIALKGKLVFSARIAQAAESETLKKKTSSRPRTPSCGICRQSRCSVTYCG
jgi:hypothetical protein